MNLWQIRLTLPFQFLVPTEAFADGFPKEFPKPVPRFPSKIRKTINGFAVGIDPTDCPEQFKGTQFSMAEFVNLTLSREADDPEKALNDSEALLESILDDFAFQLQVFVPVIAIEVLDITPPLKTGENRRFLWFAGNPNFPSPKFLSSQSMGNAISVTVPVIKHNYPLEDDKIRSAIRWFTKALAASYEIDKFVFLWISLEILTSHGEIRVSRAYTAKCGHEIANCPICGESLAREVNGATIKRYLEEFCGVIPKDAGQLWEARQMFHGSNKLTTQSVSEIPRLNLILRSAVLTALKKVSSIPLDQPPIFQPTGNSISPYIMMGGTRQLDDKDIEAAI